MRDLLHQTPLSTLISNQNHRQSSPCANQLEPCRESSRLAGQRRLRQLQHEARVGFCFRDSPVRFHGPLRSRGPDQRQHECQV